MQKLFLALLISANAFSATVINKDQPAPYRGYLFTIEEEQSLREKVIELDFAKKRIDIMIQQQGIYESNEKLYLDQITLWRDQAHSLAKINAEKQELQFWKNTFFFALGAALTTAIVYGVSQAQR
jgi:hypothetical protein